jgi:hypothetical protein
LNPDNSSFSGDNADAYNQLTASNQALAQDIVANPQNYSSDQLARAQTYLGQKQTPLADTSFGSDVSAFGTAFTDNVVAAGEKIGSIGTGVLNLASLGSWLIPLVGVTLVGILIYAFYRRTV